MLARAAAVWVLGLATIVPFGAYFLFFHAQRHQYALLITLVLFWIFGYWGIVGPVIGAIKARRVLRSIEHSTSKDEIASILRSREARDVAIDLIASEHHIPRFLAAGVYRLLMRRGSSIPTSTNPSAELPVRDEY